MRAAALAVLLVAAVAQARPKDAYLESYGGYATTEQAVIRGRVGRGRPVPDRPGRGTARKVLATARGFLARDVERAHLRIASGDQTAALVSDDEGFFEARLPGPFPPGGRRFEVRLDEKRYQAAPLALQLDVVPAGAGFVVVTDIDDTLIDTGVTTGKIDLVARIAGSDARDVIALGGAAEALAAFAAQGIPIVYLSASPVELAPRLRTFLELHRFPPGALLLRHYERDGAGDPTAYKRRRFEAVLADFPGRRLILFGDNGEQDPEIFRRLARDTGRVEVVFIRRTLAAAAGDARYEGSELFSAWTEVVELARARGILK